MPNSLARFVSPEALPQLLVCAECGALVAQPMVTDHEALHVALGLLGELVAQDVFPAPPELLSLAEKAGISPRNDLR